MKKLFIAFILLCIATSVFAQPHPDDLAGIWKVILKNSGGKVPPPPQYILFKSNNTYIWGVDSLGVEPQQGTVPGTWFLSRQKEIVLISSDTSAEIKYYRPIGGSIYKFDATQKGKVKENLQMLEMDIFLQRLPNKE